MFCTYIHYEGKGIYTNDSESLNFFMVALESFYRQTLRESIFQIKDNTPLSLKIF